METYGEFLDRIFSFEKSELNLGGGLSVSPSVALKVGEDNAFMPFYGDTVVFALDEQTKKRIDECVDTLYAAAPQCFCQRLKPHTYHVTLHDLSNSPKLADVAEQVFFNELSIAEIAHTLDKSKATPITMKSKYIFNMVNTSLVLGLYPASEHDYIRLMDLYHIFDGIKPLGYPHTPHITLAYYNVFGFDAQAAASLEQAVNKLNKDIALKITLDDLYYQKFTSVNDYIDIVKLL